jgi:lipopolysaccharide export system permease protein
MAVPYTGPASTSAKTHQPMPLIERYVFRQLLGPTLLAIAALSGIAVLSQSISALGVIVDQRQSPMVLLRITLLAMPQLIVLILPVAVLAAALVATNRLHTEQEFVVCFAGGMSRWRVISPALRLSVLLALASLVLSLWIQPLCYRALRDTLQRVRGDLVTSMVKPGRFTHPAPGVTVYAQSVDDDGTIHNLFIDRDNGKGRDVTITAREGRVERRGAGPILAMRNGANQEFSNSGALNYMSFDEYIFDLRPIMALDRGTRYKLSDKYLHELLFFRGDNDQGQSSVAKMLGEAHSRLSASIYNIAFMFMALAAVIGGEFNRLGYSARIAAVTGAALIVRMLGFAVQSVASSHPDLNLLQYLVPILATLISAGVLFGRPVRSPIISRLQFPQSGAATAA